MSGNAVQFHYAARSDVGLVRSNNQDSGYAGANLLVLADGMGGPAGGDIASSDVYKRQLLNRAKASSHLGGFTEVTSSTRHRRARDHDRRDPRVSW